MVKPLSYESGLTFEEALVKYNEILGEFKTVKSVYSLDDNVMSEEHQSVLTDCVGVLLPLGLEECVQNEFFAKRDDSLLYKIGELNQDILMYLAKFSNTGVSVIRPLE